jgi:hypothetical protein
MPIQFKCPRCAKELRIPDKLAGKDGRCPSCNSVITIPGGDDDADETPARDIPAARSKSAAPRDAIKPQKQRDLADDEDIEEAEERPDPEEEEREGTRRPAKRPARPRREEEEEEDDGSPEQDRKERRRKERARWGLARIGVLLWVIAMGFYGGSWAIRALGFTFGFCLALGGGKGDSAASSLVEITHYIAIGMFLANILLSMIGTGLTFTTPARHWARPLAIQSFCLGIAAIMLLGALFYWLGIMDPSKMAVAQERANAEVNPLPLFLFLIGIETGRTTCFAFYLKGVAESLKDSELAARALVLGILTPSFIVGLGLFDFVMLLVMRSMRSFESVAILFFIIAVVNFILLAVLAFLYFRVVRSTRETMGDVA